jgi:hypothetical protein
MPGLKEFCLKYGLDTNTGLENNTAYNEWMRWVGECLKHWGFGIITRVDPINEMIIQRMVEKSEYDPQNPLLERSTFFCLKIPKDNKRIGEATLVFSDKINELSITQQAAVKALSYLQPVAIEESRAKENPNLEYIKEEFQRFVSDSKI